MNNSYRKHNLIVHTGLTTLVLAILMTGCSPSIGTRSGQTGSDANTNGITDGAIGNFSFDLSNQNATTNGVEENGPDAQAGAELFRSVEEACSVCHGSNAEGTSALGPSLVAISEDHLRETLADDADHRGGARPNYTDDDFLNLEAFLATAGQDVDSNGTDLGADETATGTNG